MALAALQSLIDALMRRREPPRKAKALGQTAPPAASCPVRQARLALLSGAQACATADYGAAADAFVSAVIAFRRADAGDEAALAKEALGFAILRMSDRSAARAACAAAQKALERAGSRDDVAGVLAFLGDVEAAAGDSRRATAAYRQAVYMHRATKNCVGEVDVLCRDATCQARDGRIEEANQLLADARSAAERCERPDLLVLVNDRASRAIDLAAPVVFAEAEAAEDDAA